ncbi:unnamed protein product [Acanthosepion pharaonis]|uniref:Uncharacterized protein n=1 Tax=Acanthosepion pharaonis TaxID=158019 RepID=A0A812EN46_ACAPH|nr:unnamed protein product [Sepia pharaonis]
MSVFICCLSNQVCFFSSNSIIYPFYPVHLFVSIYVSLPKPPLSLLRVCLPIISSLFAPTQSLLIIPSILPSLFISIYYPGLFISTYHFILCNMSLSTYNSYKVCSYLSLLLCPVCFYAPSNVLLFTLVSLFLSTYLLYPISIYPSAYQSYFVYFSTLFSVFLSFYSFIHPSYPVYVTHSSNLSTNEAIDLSQSIGLHIYLSLSISQFIYLLISLCFYSLYIYPNFSALYLYIALFPIHISIFGFLWKRFVRLL